MDVYWNDHLEDLLPYAKVSDDQELLMSSMSVLGLPAKEIDSFWLRRRTVYVKVSTNPHRELGLRNCSGFGAVLSFVVGGKCLASSHKSIVDVKALQSKLQKEQITLKEQLVRKVVSNKCGSFAKLKSGTVQPNLDGVTDDDITTKELAWRHPKYRAFSIRCIQIANGLCDVCSGFAGRRCPGCTYWDGPYVMHGCKRHKDKIPLVPRDGRPCAECVKEQSVFASISQNKRKLARKKYNHRLKRKMPEWESAALEMAFKLIRSKRMRKEGVTRALERVQGEFNFLYPFVELQCLNKNWNQRVEYRIGHLWMNMCKSILLRSLLSQLKSLVQMNRFFCVSNLKPSLYKRYNSIY